MIIFARAPGTTGWVEINPEEELSHRGQFWEIRKFAVESDGIMPLARRLGRAEQALRAAGFQYHGPSEKWLAPKAPVDSVANNLDAQLRAAVAQRQAVENSFVALLPGTYYMDEPDGGSITTLEQFRRMAADAAKWRERSKAPGRGAGHVLVTCAAWLKTPSISAADPGLANAFANDLIKIRYELKGLHE